MDWAWVGSVGAGAICFGAGVLARMKAPKYLPASMFLAAMTAILAAMITGPLYPMVDQAYAAVAAVIAKIFVMFVLIAIAVLWHLTMIFPVERPLSLAPMNRLAVFMLSTLALMMIIGSMTVIDYTVPNEPGIDHASAQRILVTSTVLALLTTAFALHSLTKTDARGQKSALIFLSGYWLFMGSGAIWALQIQGIGPLSNAEPEFANVVMTACVAASGLIFGSAIVAGQMSLSAPTQERLVSSSKAKFRLLHRYVYLVEEPKPEFSFKMFSDILKGRCFDCENDESFTCESLDCSACSLPCPCRECTKYKSRPQGLIVTRQFPKDVRGKYYLQTTPIIWLSTVAGADNMDPAKLSLLTDYLVNFMEKSQNGVLVVDGLEYLITSNDFHRVLRAVDRWTETAMVSNSRLIMTVDARSFDPKELAMMERNREVVRPDAAEAWRIIPERI